MENTLHDHNVFNFLMQNEERKHPRSMFFIPLNIMAGVYAFGADEVIMRFVL